MLAMDNGSLFCCLFEGRQMIAFCVRVDNYLPVLFEGRQMVACF